MISKIVAYLPKPEKKVLVQAHIPESLVKEIRVMMDAYDLSWSMLITACLKQFRDEEKQFRDEEKLK